MDVIASTAFGMDIDSQSVVDHPFVENAARIMGVKKTLTFVDKLKKLIQLLMLCKFYM